MTGNKYIVRSRRRHKMEEMKTDSEASEPDFIEHIPSTSTCSHHQELLSPEDYDPEIDSEVPRRISKMSSERISTEESSNDDFTSTTNIRNMRRRRIVRTNRTRRRMKIDDGLPTSTLSSPSTKFQQQPTFNSRHSPSFLLILCLCAIFQPCLSIKELRCGPIDIRNKPWGFRNRWSHLGDPNTVNHYLNQTDEMYPPLSPQINCTVVEGSFTISFVYDMQDNHRPKYSKREEKKLELTDYPRFPYLREITGSLLIFETTALTDLGYIFPNLRVIGGQSLIQHYALVIYRNADLDVINLNKLRVIRNGGVRIQDNKWCCHVTRVDWRSMIMSNVNDVYIDDAAENSVTETGKICPKGPCQNDPEEKVCHYIEQSIGRVQSCWSNTTCATVCKWDRLENHEMGPGCDPNGDRCHAQCIGGCDRPNDPTACSACRFLHYKGKCVEKCEPHLYVLMDRRCVTKKQCLELNPVLANKSVPIKATAGLCSDKCPEGYEYDPLDIHSCRKCNGACEVVCNVNHKIDTFPKALAIRRCNVIEGNLEIEMRGKQESGMASKLKEMFANIHTITGYLSVQRSPPFLSLAMFRNLRVIQGKTLLSKNFAISIVENTNLRRLFEGNTNFTIENPKGIVQIHNNRMLCYAHIRELSKQLRFTLNETDQSPSSNGEKAICEDARIEVDVDAVGHDVLVFKWDVFNTSDLDHRKFLGYELFFKEVEKADPSMSIDDDRSACVDSWSSVFHQHYENFENPSKPGDKVYVSIGTAQRIRPNTIYAYYVATQMVHHAGAKNGLSKIGFVKTKFYHPDPPIMRVTKVETDSIMLAWEPPRQPNGEITHYTIAWRELDVNVHEEAKMFCDKEVPGYAKSTHVFTDTASSEPDEEDVSSTSSAPSLTSLTSLIADEGTCAAVPGCCSCTGMTSSELSETADESASFENNLMDTVITPRADVRIRRSIKEAEELDKSLNSKMTATKPMTTTQKPPKKKPLVYVTAKTSTTTPHPFTASKSAKTPTQNTPVVHDEMIEVAGRKEINVTAKEFENMFELKGLKHFTTYGITISACQNLSVPENSCSPAHKAGTKKRTKPLLNIDKIDPTTVQVHPHSNVRNLNVTWDDVAFSNGGIIGYIVKLHSITGSAPTQRCVSALANYSAARDGVEFLGLHDGKYEIHITAYSPFRNGETMVWKGPHEVDAPGWWTYEIIALILAIFFLIIAAIAGGVYYYLQVRYGKKVKALSDFMHLNPEYCVENKYTADDWELKASEVELGQQCGEGSFGKVFLGHGKNIYSQIGEIFGPCAIKINSDDPQNASENLNYLMEANIMKNFKTSFIVKLFGVVSSVHPAMVVMEVMELGNLRDYLRSKREDEVFNEMDCNFYDIVPRERFCEWAAQICDGMAYLESLKFCHRDLAARNCMIDATETVKIGDFGMARDLFYHDYYKPSGKRMMPVRWMSPESLKDGKFDSKSDIWSFGVVLYEMVTLGAQPYIGLSNDEVLNYIGMARKVIKQPECCSDYWYKIMKMCWRYAPRDRPTFLQLVHLLSAEASAEFKQRSFVFTENQMAMEDAEPLDLDEIYNIEPSDENDIVGMDHHVENEETGERRHTDSIPMKEFRSDQLNSGLNSHSTISMGSHNGHHTGQLQKKQRQRSLDDEYALMNHSRGPSDTEVRNYGGDDGDYVERDVQNDMPTRRNTGASTSSYTGGPYCLANRGGSNERAGFGEGLRLTDAVGSGHLHDDSDYVEKELNSMDTRRSTGASTASYGVPQPTNWSGNRGATYYANRQQQQQQQAAAPAQNHPAHLNGGRGDRLTQLPGTGHLQNRGGPDGDYIATEPRKNDGSPSRNGNSSSNRGSFNGRSAFGENERLIEDTEHPLG